MKNDLTVREKEILVHALTGSIVGRRVYRNFYTISAAHHAVEVVAGLVAKGLLRVGRTQGEQTRYHVTNAGALAAGLNLPGDDQVLAWAGLPGKVEAAA